eukprot:2301169-Pleurochrysis_carterae.AAC.1
MDALLKRCAQLRRRRLRHTALPRLQRRQDGLHAGGAAAHALAKLLVRGSQIAATRLRTHARCDQLDEVRLARNQAGVGHLANERGGFDRHVVAAERLE